MPHLDQTPEEAQKSARHQFQFMGAIALCAVTMAIAGMASGAFQKASSWFFETDMGHQVAKAIERHIP